MRLKLEYDDAPVFGTIKGPLKSELRALVVKINGKPFTTWARLETYMYRVYDDEYMRTRAGWRIHGRALTINAIETRPVRRLRGQP